MLGDVEGKKVTVLAQDSAFGTANVEAIKSVLGEKGADVTAIEAPAAKDFTPFATKIKSQSPDLLFVAWAGENATCRARDRPRGSSPHLATAEFTLALLVMVVLGGAQGITGLAVRATRRERA